MTNLTTSKHPIMGGHVVASDGTRLAYLSVGEGPTLLLVHGGLGQGLGWKPVADQLADAYRVILLDRRAHGMSDWGGGPNLQREAEDVIEVIEAIGPIVGLVGHSYGATVVLLAALDIGPRVIPQLIIYEPPLRTGPPMWEGVIDIARDLIAHGSYEAALTLLLGSDAGNSPEEVAMFRSMPIWPSLVALAPTAVPCGDSINSLGVGVERFRSMAVPTLMLRGAETRDPMVVEASRLLGAVLPSVTTITLEGQSHHALMTAPERVAREILQFLSSSV